MGGGTMSHIKAEEDYEQRQRDAKKRAELELELAREQMRARKEVTPDPASGFRPIDKNNIPPENTVVLVRYKASRPEVRFTEVSRTGSKVDQHRVYPALVIYSRAPFSTTEMMFRGFVVLRARSEQGAADAAKYMDGDVPEAFDGWMPMPS
jgi:hypothetical protein